MAQTPAAATREHLWTIAVARLLFEPEMNIQAPPNLADGDLAPLIGAGINDWGGVSPVTPDHVNPEAPWPQLSVLEAACRCFGQAACRAAGDLSAVSSARSIAGSILVCELLCFVASTPTAGRAPTRGRPERSSHLPEDEARAAVSKPALATGNLSRLLDRAVSGRALTERDIVSLFRSRGDAFSAVTAAADDLRASVCGDAVSYVVTRNINYTNICSYRCQFCAFSKGKTSENLRGRPYELSGGEISRACPPRRGRAAPPKSACKAASIPRTPGRPISISVER